METASTPSEMPPPQTKDVIKNGKGKYPIKLIMLISLSLVFLHFRISIPLCSCFVDISNSIECHKQFEFFDDFCLRTYNIDSLCSLCFCHTFLYAPIKDKDLL